MTNAQQPQRRQPLTDDERTRADRSCQQRLGKPFAECSTDELLDFIIDTRRETLRKQADIDRAEAAHRDAALCGCPVIVPMSDRGAPDVGNSYVGHRSTCPERLRVLRASK